jgi:hypothetical protein
MGRRTARAASRLSEATPVGAIYGAIYGTIHKVVKTTVYLPDALKRALARLARERKRSEAELIRLAVERLVEAEGAPRPTLPLFHGRDPELAERVDEYLAGFGT